MAFDFTLGQNIRIRGTFRDVLTGTLVDPDNLVYHTRQGGSGTVVYTYGIDSQVVRVSTGVYDLILLLSAAGKGLCRAITTGSRPCSGVAQWSTIDPNF